MLLSVLYSIMKQLLRKKDLSKQYKIPYTYQNTLFSADINFSPYKEKLLFSSLFIKAKGVLNYQGKQT